MASNLLNALNMSVSKQGKWASWIAVTLLAVLLAGYLPATGLGVALATVLLPKVKTLEFYKNHPQWCSTTLTFCLAILFLGVLTVLSLSVSTTIQDIARSERSVEPERTTGKAQQSQVSVRQVSDEVQEKMGESIHWLAINLPYSETKLKKSISLEGEKFMEALLNQVRKLLTDIPGMLPLFYMMFLGFFFTLVEGEYFSCLIKDSGIFSERQFQVAQGAYLRGCRSVFVGSLVCGLIQATLLFLLMLFFGVPALFLGFLVTFFLSFLPVIGTLPVILVISLYISLNQALSAGLTFLVLGSIFVGASDNIIRPIAMRQAGNIHPLLGALSIFGCISLMGLPGLFLGPILASVLWSLSVMNGAATCPHEAGPSSLVRKSRNQ